MTEASVLWEHTEGVTLLRCTAPENAQLCISFYERLVFVGSEAVQPGETRVIEARGDQFVPMLMMDATGEPTVLRASSSR